MAPSVRAKKLFLGVRDEDDLDRRQFAILTTLTDGNELLVNQYAKMFTEDEIGSFDVVKDDNVALLEFFPIDLRTNKYSFSFISYDTKQTIFNNDSFDLGNTVSVGTTNIVSVAGSGTNTVFTIPPDIKSGKLLLETSSQEENNFEYNELNFVSATGIGTTTPEVYFTEFGKMTISEESPSGIGTYGITSDGEVTFTPNIEEDFRTNVIAVSIANTEFNATASQNLRYANVESLRVSIAATDTPEPVLLSQVTSTFNTAYYIVQAVGFNTVTQQTSTQLTELVSLNNNVDATLIQYGDIVVGDELGVFDVNAASLVELFFTPVEDTNVEITILQHTVTYSDFIQFPASVNFNNAELSTGVTILNQSSNVAFKKDFDLTHREIPIFERRFNGSLDLSSNLVGVDLANDLIYLPNHYFVTGEKIVYRSQGAVFVELTDTLVSSTASIGSTTIDVDSTFSLKTNDFLEADGTGKLRIIDIENNTLFIGGELSVDVLAGAGVTFFRLNEGVDNTNTLNAIGIAQTFIAGVGNTDKLSGDLYIYKKDELFIGFGTSPEDVALDPPKLIDLTSAGVGNNHYVTSTSQNTKCLIAIDNMIQSPIISTATTCSLTDNMEIVETTVFVSDLTDFEIGDLIRIDDEMMKITAAGVGTTSLEFQVERPFLGTFLQDHTAGATITKFDGNYNIVGSKIYFAEAPYGPITDPILGDVNITSTFQGRSFMRSADPQNTEKRTYKENYLFDNLQDQFNAIDKDFVLTSFGEPIVGIKTLNSISLINGIFQNPDEDYEFVDDTVNTEIQFTGSATSALYDPNNASIPRGGIPVSIGSSTGFGYQPLISAGGTAVVSSTGTIQSISIGYSGSGYREGIQTIVNVGVQTSSTGIPNIEFIGTAAVSNGSIVSVAITNPGTGYTTSNPPTVIFDKPLSYENLDLIYQSPSSGFGTEAKINIVVGQGSSVIDFDIVNYGYSFKVGDILTVESGGPTGIPTISSAPFENFSIIIESIRNDIFTGWTIGELEPLDNFDADFDGFERTFPISKNNNRFAIVAREGSLIDVSAVLLVFVNDVLQEPNVAYTFPGGSQIQFTEAPSAGSKSRIYFYKGTPDVDVVDVDLLETVQVGDTLQIVGESASFIEEPRLVKDVFLVDTVKTNNYNSVGVSSDNELLRPVTWCKQREDTFVNGLSVPKNRVSYEPNIYPIAQLLQPIGAGTTIMYVDNISTIFDQSNENVDEDYIDSIEVVDYYSDYIGATASVTIDSEGIVDSISISNPGIGYSEAPSVSIAYPNTGVIDNRATAVAFINNGQVDQIEVTNPGSGYTSTNPPIIIIDSPKLKYDTAKKVSYSGDFGVVTGVKIGAASTELIFDLYIPEDSFLRDSKFKNPPITESQIEVGDYFKVSNSTGSNPVTSRRVDESSIGVGTVGIDNVYQVLSVGSATTTAIGAGTVTLTQVLVAVDSNVFVSTGTSSYFGDFSWGRIELDGVPIENNYNLSIENGVVGLNDTPIVRRINPLKYVDYL